MSRGPLHTARRILDAALPLREQAAKWAWGADRSAALSAADLATALAACQGSAGIIVAVSHDDYVLVYGGIQNVLADEQRAFEAAGWYYLHVAPAAPLPILGAQGPEDAYRLQLRLNGKRLGCVTFPVLAEGLAASRGRGTRLEIVFHHLKGHVPEFLATLPAAAGARPIVWVHDFFTLCPSFNLMRNDVKFCGAPPASSAACSVCVFGIDRQDHSPRVRAFFEATHPVVLAPSEAALDFWSRQSRYPRAGTRVVPLARLLMARQTDPIITKAGSPLRVAHVGASTVQKGWHVFEELAVRHAGDRRYKFYQLGIDGVRSSKYIHDPVQVGPEQRNAMIEAVVRHRIDVVICWSLWPETFCFTVYEALAGGAFVVARRGAGNVWPAVRANAYGQGCVGEDEAGLFQLFESGDIQTLVARASRFRGTLHPGGNTAEFLLKIEPGPVIQNDLESVDG